mgnify:CR=1 FL=1|jgi:hypothetical protein|tara:strand:+ start:802 stop:1203 length:402 start_codon:yes stop_codon:yes gene_type:complete
MGLLSKAQDNAAKRQARRAAERSRKAAAKDARRASSQQARQSAGETIGEILQQSQDFTEGQIQQTRDAAASAFDQYGDDVIAAYTGGIIGGPSTAAPTSTSTSSTTTDSAAPSWLVPAAIVGAGGLWLASRRK